MDEDETLPPDDASSAGLLPPAIAPPALYPSPDAALSLPSPPGTSPSTPTSLGGNEGDVCSSCLALGTKKRKPPGEKGAIDTPLITPISSSSPSFSPSMSQPSDTPMSHPLSSTNHSNLKRAHEFKLFNTRNHRRISRTKLVATLLILAAGTLALLAVILDSFLHHLRDREGCASSYMRPRYIRQAEFDSERTRFAGKYTLYLYRESGYDVGDEPSGIPVLFIPGNAGSYKQMRSIAAEAAIHFFQLAGEHKEAQESELLNLDFFTVDFNEELTAFHGNSLLEQAEYLNDAIQYILTQYPQGRRASLANRVLPDPTSVIVVGHSMGGVVARTMFIMPNFQPGTINTLLTFATPHLLPPVTFDPVISKIYAEITQFWRRGYETGRLSEVVVVSVVSGRLDEIVSSDTANLNSIVPPTHGFTVFTSGVPNVWLSTDHLCILWCNQLVRVVAKALLDISDARLSGQTKPVAERVEILRKALVDGLEEGFKPPERAGHLDRARTLVDLNKLRYTLASPPSFAKNLSTPRATLDPESHLIPIPSTTLNSFSLLTDQPLGSRFDVLLCEAMDALLPLDRLLCVSVSAHAIPVPASSAREEVAFSGRTFQLVEMSTGEMHDFQYVVWMDRGGPESVSGFVVAEFFNSEENSVVDASSIKDILTRGLHVGKFEGRPILSATVQMPALEGGLLAYRLSVSQHGCPPDRALFTPLVRQSIPTMHEVKYHVNVSEVDLLFHGPAPYSTSLLASSDKRGLKLRIWADPSCPGGLDVRVRLNLYGSLGRLVMPYRLVLATYPMIIVLLVLRWLLRSYQRGAGFPHFGEGIYHVLKKTLPLLILVTSALALYQVWRPYTPSPISAPPLWPETAHLRPALHAASASVSIPPPSSLLKLRKFSTFPFPVDASIHLRLPLLVNSGRAFFGTEELLLGNTDPLFWWLPGFFLLIAAGITVVLWAVVGGLLRLAVQLMVGLELLGLPPVCTRLRASPGSNVDRFQRRLVATVVLFVLVATLFPHQFAFVVGLLVEVVSCIRAGIQAHVAPHPADRQRHRNRFHYLEAVLVLLIAMLPFNLTVLMVWIRNLSVLWLVPFSSDHNLLSVAPVLFHAELMASDSDCMFEELGGWRTRLLMEALWAIGCVSGVVFGVRYAWWVNWVSVGGVLWLCWLHLRKETREMNGRINEWVKRRRKRS
ncbi:uncharacterized protein VTP21DRAFT_2314 [Calcarisporiella thermophila]|uniref:uncharacterized protein n=1 Tax=Calcarisporiella thermophila TaxID=911321 RepID=UPI0037432366